MRIYQPVLDDPVRAIQNPAVGAWSVVLPIARTNMITNPSVETDTTGYTAVGGSIARSTTQQYHGAYSLAITPTAGTSDGVYYGTVSLTSGTTYAVSCKIYGAAGVSYKLSVATTAGADLVARRFTGNGRWRWIWLIWTETSSTTRRIYLTKSGSTSTAVVYLDGLQCEACETGQYWPTTYIDGDQAGLVANQYPAAYAWTGTPHASTSVRSGQTRAGGRVVNLQSAYRFWITGTAGLDLAPPQHQALAFSQLDGGQLQSTIVPPRQFSIAGVLDAESEAQRARLAADLAFALGYQQTGLRQPIRLIYEPYDGTTAIGDACDVIAIYTDGLGSLDTRVRTSLAVTFTQYTPGITRNSGGAALASQTNLAGVAGIVRRTAAGVWSLLSTGINGPVYELAITPDGALYAGGLFSSPAKDIAKWNGTAWAALGADGLDNTVQAMAVGPDGALYVGGSFSTVGIANTKGIAKWDGSNWSALGTGGAGSTTDFWVYGLAFDSAGNLYAVGSFIGMGGVAGADKIAKWDGATWTTVGAGSTFTQTINAVAVGLDDSVYVTGVFTSPTTRIARWASAAWGALSTGLDNTGWALVFGANGLLYVSGAFTTAGGVSASRIAQWNGVQFQPLGSGVNGIAYESRWLRNRLYVTGPFTTANGMTLPDGLAIYDGTWASLDIDLGGSAVPRAVAIGSDDTLYVGGESFAATAVVGSTTTVTNTGSAPAYPRLTIRGPSSGTSIVYQISNTTTGRRVFFSLTISAGETVWVNFDPKNITCISSFRGSIRSAIVLGSHEASFALQPGTNVISFLAASSTVTAVLEWLQTEATLQDAIW